MGFFLSLWCSYGKKISQFLSVKRLDGLSYRNKTKLALFSKLTPDRQGLLLNWLGVTVNNLMLCILFQQHILHNSPECVPSWAALHTSSISEQHYHYTSQHNMWNCGYNQTECFDCKWKGFFQCWWECIEASANFSAVAEHQISWLKYQHTLFIEHFIQLMIKMCLETW